ncbi:MAG: selenide, water dikinase SelD [Planctomycetaceae bacterium]
MRSRLADRALVLIGAGHTNLHVVRMWRMRPIPGVELTLVSPFGRATYSGMLAGTLAGQYAPDEMEIDLYRFAQSCGVRYVDAAVAGFDPESREVRFDDRPPLRFDVASIGLGSVPSGSEVWKAHREVLSIKPMPTFRARFEARLQEVYRETNHARICVVGGGAAGVEVAFCLERLLQQRRLHAALTLVDSNDRLLPGYRPATSRLARRECDRRGIRVETERRARDYSDGKVRFEEGPPIEADIVVWATAAAPPAILAEFHLPNSDDGFLAVRRTLRTIAEFPVFVVGDTATIVDSPVPKAGVYAVREGRILWENLRRLFEHRPLVEYDPQRGFLSLIGTGDGRAIGEYKGVSFHNRLAWKWKDHLDRKFMRMYQDYRPMTAEMSAAADEPGSKSVPDARSVRDAAPVMRCRGCGGKVGAGVLAAALDRLKVASPEGVRIGLDRPDDAAVLDPARHPAEVLSVDFFQPFLDDPYLVGRIAALNALSDLWAMGAEPTGAMAMAAIPPGPPRRQAEYLFQMLAGGLRELTAAGATLLGGHTTESDEPTIGYTVIGSLRGREPLAKGNLREGDSLLLTKPLGTGAILAGHMRSAARAAWMRGMLERMLHSNAEAARIARVFEVESATDVTGFGLAGHLLEMLDAAKRDADLWVSEVPLLDGFAEMAVRGIRSTLEPSNRLVADRIVPDEHHLRDDPAWEALFDPQTAGGLLLAVRPEAALALRQALREAGHREAAVIGVVGGESETPIVTARRQECVGGPAPDRVPAG